MIKDQVPETASGKGGFIASPGSSYTLACGHLVFKTSLGILAFFATPHRMWDLGFLTKDQTHAPLHWKSVCVYVCVCLHRCACPQSL